MVTNASVRKKQKKRMELICWSSTISFFDYMTVSAEPGFCMFYKIVWPCFVDTTTTIILLANLHTLLDEQVMARVVQHWQTKNIFRKFVTYLGVCVDVTTSDVFNKNINNKESSLHYNVGYIYKKIKLKKKLTSRAIFGNMKMSSSLFPIDNSSFHTNGCLGTIDNVPFVLKTISSCRSISLIGKKEE